MQRNSLLEVTFEQKRPGVLVNTSWEIMAVH